MKGVPTVTLPVCGKLGTRFVWEGHPTVTEVCPWKFGHDGACLWARHFR